MEEFPKFKKGEVQKIFLKLSKKDQDIINKFVKYVSITSSSSKRLENNKRTITAFRYIIKKDLDKISLQDLRDYLSLLKSSDNTNSTQNEYKASIKRFLRWKFKGWSDRFQNLEDIKLHMKINEEKINSDTLVLKEDIEKIVRAEQRTYWKAFFLTLYESGLRPGELRTLTWDKIKLNVEGDISELNIYATKTHKARSVYVSEATFFLQKLKEQREDFSNPLVFPAKSDPSKPVRKDTVSQWLGRISQEVLGRRIYPYILRHSRATELYTNANIPDKIAQKFLGHSKSMGDVYTHMSNKDVKEAVGKTIYKFEDFPPEKRIDYERRIDKLEKSNKEIKEEVLLVEEDKSRMEKQIEELQKKQQLSDKLMTLVIRDQEIELTKSEEGIFNEILTKEIYKEIKK